MTVAAGTRLSSAGDGTTTIFTPTFRANSAAELAVVLVQDSDGTKTDQVLNTDYTVSFASGTAGVPTITFTTAPAAGYTVIITPLADIKQGQSIADTTPLFGSTVEAALDAMSAQIQDLNDRLGTCFRASRDDPDQTPIGDWKDRLDTYAYFNATTGQLEAKALSLIQVDLGTLDADLGAIGALTPSDDDIIQRKASAWVNRTMAQLATDVGTELPDGTVTLPSIAFAADPDTGFYRIGANNIGIATAGAKALDIDADGHITKPLSSAFLAYANADILNVTGNNTTYTVLFNTEVYDRNADFVPGTSIFTAPVTGIYNFSGAVALLALGTASHIRIQLVTSNRTYDVIHGDPTTYADAGAASWNWSVDADMDATDTAYLQITVNGAGADSVDLDGDTSAMTFFSGRLVG